MKKNLLYLLALVTIAFASCDPLKDTYNDIKPTTVDRTIVINAAKTYETTALANAGIVEQLNKDYPQMPDGTKANVTYGFKSNTVKPVDSVYANIQYTVTTNDYTDAAAAVGNGTFKTYSVAQAAAFLEWKYPQATTPLNKLVLLTYQFFQSNATPSAGVTVTEAFLLQSSGWQKIYLISPAQYTALGRGINNGFTSADVSSLPVYFNNFLKADPLVISPKAGDVKYITYKYMQSATIMHQKIYLLTYDGANWTATTTLSFLKQKGKWIPDPTIYYTMIAADYLNLNLTGVNYTFGTATNRGNVANFKSFNISATNGTQWTTAEIKEALKYTLNLRFPNATANPELPYKITYYAYSGTYAYVTVTFIKTANGFEEPVTP
ncbi:hypothetical protein [Pedobacter heparinus]|uniref:Uncharacterized protein n=1 Tax=Pedobacter heparinus (strain ATCC 13125 / DSM 2366 / CIP 104194 / JCM 7457 / NBRC 12017 / NCIMB 9290 / NRRL B-14731 / HIM 762-3) TaxID=485917 RepID=C6Y2I7_PEDHD|nr:hypothetical protein [Pedobacter heparinus]ACU05197.1 hypothetical protein Phep_2999 [Pedobacter heparinus DSM 2366]